MGNTQGSFRPLHILLQTWNGGAGGSTQENAVLPTYLQSLPFPTQSGAGFLSDCLRGEDWANGRISV